MIYLYEYTPVLSLALVSNLAYVLYTRSNNNENSKTFFYLLSRHTDKHIDQINRQETEALSELRLLHSKLEYELQSGDNNNGHQDTLKTLDDTLRDIETKTLGVTNSIKERANSVTRFRYHSCLSVIAVAFTTLLLILAPWSKYGCDFTPLFLLSGSMFVSGVLYASAAECYTVRQWSVLKRMKATIVYVVVIVGIGLLAQHLLSPLCSASTRLVATYFCLAAAFSNFIVYFVQCKCRLLKLSKIVYPRELKRIKITQAVRFCEDLAGRVTAKDVSYPADKVNITSC